MKNSNPKPENQNQEKMPDIWESLEQAGKGELIQHFDAPQYKLTTGEHYWVVSDPKRLEISCTSCPIKHGGIIDAHEAYKTNIIDGVIYVDGNPISKTPSSLTIQS